jgi:Flp pilus assembly protein TadD
VFCAAFCKDIIQSTFERHAYVGDVGLFMALGALAAEWTRLRTKRVREATAIVGVLALAVLTVIRNREYRSEAALWRSTVREAPRNPRAWNNLGIAHEHAHEPNAAISAYVHALAADPRYTPARKDLERLTR